MNFLKPKWAKGLAPFAPHLSREPNVVTRQDPRGRGMAEFAHPYLHEKRHPKKKKLLKVINFSI